MTFCGDRDGDVTGRDIWTDRLFSENITLDVEVGVMSIRKMLLAIGEEVELTTTDDRTCKQNE